MDLVGKPNVTSPIWEHFGFVPNEKGEPINLDEAICMLCGKKISVKRAITSNLQSHLRSCLLNANAQLVKLGITEAFSKMAKYKRESDKWKTLTRNVATFLVAETLHTVEKPAFREMLESFDKQYELLSRKYFSNTVIPQLFNETKEKIITELHDLDFFSVMCLTVHFVNKNWDPKSSHTADNLAESLHGAVKEWGLNEKNVACITTDNGANIVAAVRKLEWPWLNCFGHNLNLAVTNSMSAEKERTSRAMGLC
ncbi:E3 SUMO-protein ligase ZBED1 [Labeo rohita]|uniref:E3 SUMO-protein ligase ZBED1 n=1 Tax=Labeo rohita TaxID=84645 RepID=A0ABQ8LDI2_LABRO|nr:E3 SUMO-protein ligase ZBED1 [Labeo rohita]